MKISVNSSIWDEILPDNILYLSENCEIDPVKFLRAKIIITRIPPFEVEPVIREAETSQEYYDKIKARKNLQRYATELSPKYWIYPGNGNTDNGKIMFRGVSGEEIKIEEDE